VSTIYVDSQKTEIGKRAVAAFTASIVASGRMSVVEDREKADARLRLTVDPPGTITFDLISGPEPIWTTTSKSADGTPESFGRSAAEALVRAAGPVQQSPAPTTSP